MKNEIKLKYEKEIKFFNHVFKEYSEGYIEVRHDLNYNGELSNIEHFKVTDGLSKILDSFLKRNLIKNTNISFGVIPRIDFKKSGSKENLVSKSSIAFLDIDFPKDENFKDQLKALEKKCKQTKYLPFGIIHSGNGIHLYFKLPKLYTIEEIEEINNQLVTIFSDFGADSQACDSSRVMRLPGTFNLKDKTTPKKVKVLLFRPSYSISENLVVNLLYSSKVNPVINLNRVSDEMFASSLSIEESEKFVNLLSPFFKEGNRNNLTMGIIATLMKAKMNRNQIENICFEIVKKSNNLNYLQQMKKEIAIQFNRATKKGLKKLAGVSKIKEILEKNFALKKQKVEFIIFSLKKILTKYENFFELIPVWDRKFNPPKISRYESKFSPSLMAKYLIEKNPIIYTQNQYLFKYD